MKEKHKGRTSKEYLTEETEWIDDTITRIWTLLALSFGEAGSKIITNNIKSDCYMDNMKSGSK